MIEELRDKVLQEYEKYKTIKMIEGKERIYGQAGQVALTMRIKDTILSMKFSKEELNVLLNTVNLLDKLCLLCAETESLSHKAIKKEINKFVREKWHHSDTAKVK